MGEGYTITKQHNNKKDIDIWVVRPGGERVDKSVYTEWKNTAKKHGKGYWSSFTGVKGFVFETPEDAKAFATEVWGKENPQQNQPASSDNSQQDLTTGFAVDNVADNAAKVMISKQSAKHELDKLVHKYVGQRKTRGFIGDLAAALGNRDSRPYSRTQKKGSELPFRALAFIPYSSRETYPDSRKDMANISKIQIKTKKQAVIKGKTIQKKQNNPNRKTLYK